MPRIAARTGTRTRRWHRARGSRWVRALGVLAVFASAAAVPAPAPAQTPAEIVDRVDQLLRGASSTGSLTMNVTTRQWSRSIDLRLWSLDTEYALLRVTAPAKDAGTATLKVKNEVWNYLPRVDRTIKIPPSLMSGAWMGSHLTNDDLVKESRMVRDYDITIGYQGDRDGARVWEFVLVPKPDAAVVWGKIVMQVRQTDLMPVWEHYYDDAGRLARTMTFGDYRSMGGRIVPATMTVVPSDKPDEHTTITYHTLSFDVGLTPAFFSLRNLRSGG
jgi:outer membrane lipoprotein-sorting protein